MADISRAFIAKVIEEGDLGPVLKAKVRPSWFEDQDHRRVFAWILDFYGRYGSVPTERSLKAEFPTYRLPSVMEPYEYYIDKMRSLRKRTLLVEGVVAAHDALAAGDDVGSAQAHLARTLERLGLEVTALTDENAVETHEERIVAYKEKKANAGKLTGIPTGFPTLDAVSGGFHEQQFVLFGGRPKQGKSFLLLKSAIAAQDAGYKVLFLSFEMSAFEQLARYDAITCGVNVNHILQGSMDLSELKKLRQGMRRRTDLPPFIVSSDISATTTVSGLSAKVDEHDPDIVFVDGVYLMESESGADPGSAQAMTSISRGLKRLSQRMGRPLVATTQALESKMDRKKGVVSMYSFAYSSAWSQDADLLLGVERQDESDILTLRVVAGRSVAPKEIGIFCNWERSEFFETDQGDDDDGE